MSLDLLSMQAHNEARKLLSLMSLNPRKAFIDNSILLEDVPFVVQLKHMKKILDECLRNHPPFIDLTSLLYPFLLLIAGNNPNCTNIDLGHNTYEYEQSPLSARALLFDSTTAKLHIHGPKRNFNMKSSNSQPIFQLPIQPLSKNHSSASPSPPLFDDPENASHTENYMQSLPRNGLSETKSFLNNYDKVKKVVSSNQKLQKVQRSLNSQTSATRFSSKCSSSEKDPQPYSKPRFRHAVDTKSGKSHTTKGSAQQCPTVSGFLILETLMAVSKLLEQIKHIYEQDKPLTDAIIHHLKYRALLEQNLDSETKGDVPEMNSMHLAGAEFPVSARLINVSNAITHVIDAVAMCRFDPTDPETDQLLVALIVQISSQCVEFGCSKLLPITKCSDIFKNIRFILSHDPDKKGHPSLLDAVEQSFTRVLDASTAPQHLRREQKVHTPIDETNENVDDTAEIEDQVSVNLDFQMQRKASFILNYATYYERPIGISARAVLTAFQTNLRILSANLNLKFLSHAARRAISSITTNLSQNLPQNSQKSNWSIPEINERNKNSDILRNMVVTFGIFEIPWEKIAVDEDFPGTERILMTILIISSHIIDPKCKRPLIERHLALSILSSALNYPSRENSATNVEEVRIVLLRETSRSLLRALGDYNDSPEIIAECFGLAISLLHMLGADGGTFLYLLMDKIFPSYVMGIGDISTIQAKVQSSPQNSEYINDACREIGLEALQALFSNPRFLCVAFTSIDCNKFVSDAIESLIKTLGTTVTACALFKRKFPHLRNNYGMENQSALAGVDQTIDDLYTQIRCSDTVGHLCGSILTNAMENLSDRMINSDDDHLSWMNGGPELKQVTTESLLAQKTLKKALSFGAKNFNSKSIKKGAVDVRNLLSQCVDVSSGHTHPQDSQTDCGDSFQNFTENDVDSVVSFLRETYSLDKRNIGLVLGFNDAFSKAVLTAYTKTFNFKGKSFNTALRVYLESFRLPGEAQVIDRIVHAFASEYIAANNSGNDNAPGTPLRSVDAGYILSYAVVMLNTDQHNSSVKTRMTVEDFVRNNRGINEGEDLPRAFLEDIYFNIKNFEIKMSDDMAVTELTDIHWDELIQLGEQNLVSKRRTTLIQPNSIRAMDLEIFKVLWGPTLASLIFFFGQAEDPESVGKVLESFAMIISCAARWELCEPVEASIKTLCSGTSVREGPLLGAMARFGNSVKSQMTFIFVTKIVREYADYMRLESWQTFTSLILRLHALNLLPPSLGSYLGRQDDDLVDLQGNPLPLSEIIPEWWPVKLQSQAANVEVERAYDPPAYLYISDHERDAEELARSCICSCSVDDILIHDTKFFFGESLKSMAESLSIASEKILKSGTSASPTTSAFLPQSDYRSNISREYGKPPPKFARSLSENDERKAREFVGAFCVELLCDLTLKNRDRLHLVWPSCHETVTRILAWANQSSGLLDAGIRVLFRIAIRLLHREEIRDDVVRTLNLLLKLPEDAFNGSVPQIAAGVYNLVRNRSQDIAISSNWHAMLSIIETLAKYPNVGSSLGFETLSLLLSKKIRKMVVTKETFQAFLDAVSAYTASSNVSTRAAIDLLFVLSECIPDMFACEKIGLGKGENGTSNLWREYWSPLLRAFAGLGRDSRVDVRNYSLLVLEKIVETGKSEEFLSSEDWLQSFTLILIPLVKNMFSSHNDFFAFERNEISERETKDLEKKMILTTGAKKTRLRGIVLFSKAFLEHYLWISKGVSEDEFLELWLSVIEVFKMAYIQTTSNNVFTEYQEEEKSQLVLLCDNLLKEQTIQYMNDLLSVCQASGHLKPSREPFWSRTVSAMSWAPNQSLLQS